ncbi:MAG: hypothetical protein C0502_07840 [Opitutus sp.]|nr:hypothetical protein [Opitutus sp.]
MKPLRSPLLSSYTILFGAATVGMAAAVAGTAFWLRAGLREQIFQREAASLHTMIVWQRALERERVDSLGLGGEDAELALGALATTRHPDVLGAQVFDAGGRPATGPASALAIPAPTAEEWARLRALQPMARFTPGNADTLDVVVPLHEPGSAAVNGAARFLLDGARVRVEFARLDRRLLWQGLSVWTIAAAALAGTLALVFRRLRRAESALLARTADLQQANRELTFVAKTSALGAITAHLVHGLRNPIAGLESLARGAQAENETGGNAGALHEASSAARRMRQIVDEVVVLLREEQSGAVYQVSPPELLESVAGKTRELAGKLGAELVTELEPGAGAVLDNRTAALCGAILGNLARNACEADGRRRVILRACTVEGAACFEVEDDGPGLPASVAARLFEPTQSTKPAGAGIGLAISRQLAHNLGARLEHHPRHPHGTRFRLRLPKAT